MKQIELIDKRKPREKHFIQQDGTFIAKVYDTDVHYMKDGKYEEIDNHLNKEKDFYVNKSNSFKVKFSENASNYLIRIYKLEDYLNISLKNAKESKISIINNTSKICSSVSYESILNNVDLKYTIYPNKLKEVIILEEKEFDIIQFIVNTNLNLIQEKNKIIAKKNNEVIFTFDNLYMEDANGKVNNNIYYHLKKEKNGYEIDLILDKEWLTSENVKFPVIIDPTISTESNQNSFYDTYIYPGDTNINRGSQDILKAGVERINGNNIVNRTLIKFELPEIGTGSEIINASLTFVPYLSSNNSGNFDEKLVTLHRITTDWTESGANWEQMNNQYDTHVEGIMSTTRSTISGNTLNAMLTGTGITNLVKKWYRDTPNYGILIKSAKEQYIDDDYPAFFSKDNNVSGNPKPYFTMYYRNQTGLESYLDYKTQKFTNGTTFINTYNGNMIVTCDLGHTVGGQLPANLKLFYNTNDVVLNKNRNFGVGFKINYDQTLEEKSINNVDYLEYVDEDGTLHYFVSGDNINYYDEDGLGLKIVKDTNECIMTDNLGNKLTFTKIEDIYYLTNIKDYDNNTISIELDNNNRINRVIDKNNSMITITYENNSTTISSPDMVTILNYSDNKISSIQTVDGIIGILYNNGLIVSIIDPTGIRLNYEYYSETPYKTKKVLKYGLNNSLGQHFTLEYGFNSTTIIDNKNRYETLIFNDEGNLLSKNSLGYSENIKSGYSISQTFGAGSNMDDKNKILSSSTPIRYIKNYLKNTSFETNVMLWNLSENITSSFSENIKNSGNRSLELVSTTIDQSIEQSISVPKGNHYTFSGYFKNNEDITIKLKYIDENNQPVLSEEIIEASNEFVRSEVTIYYDENAVSNLDVLVDIPNISTIYIDDVQLEEGEVANEYNIIENSDFSEGLNDWTLSVADENHNSVDSSQIYEIVDINNNHEKALKINMNPSYMSTMSKEYPIKGEEGDLYTISFWYKNEGVEGCRPYAGNNVSIYFIPNDDEAEYCILSQELNINDNRWQYFTYRSRALEDFKAIQIKFTQYTNANNCYITNISFYKNTTSGDFNYDENGNLLTVENQSKEKGIFQYDTRNQLISTTTPKGKNFKFEYDNEKPNRILNATSSSGISNRIRYDENGNPITTIISHRNSDIIENGMYRIRSKGTDKYIKANNRNIIVSEDTCSNTIWNIVNIDNNYKFIYSVLTNYSISYNNQEIKLNGLNQNNLFTLIKNDDGSYCIKLANGENNKYLKVNEDCLEIDLIDVQDHNFYFYIELVDRKFIENNAIYTADGRFISEIESSNLEKISYTTNPVSGLITAITDDSGNTTNYSYNSRKQITSISKGNRTINYQYNDSNLLSKASNGAIEYNFQYDEFLNQKSIKIGNDVYTSNDYEQNNGNMIATNFGNQQRVEYEYDQFDRINKIKFMNDNYNYKYDNNGNIAKIISNNHTEKFNYDISGRLYEHKYDNFKTNYIYDTSDNVINESFKIDNNNHTIEYVINNDDIVTKVVLDNDEINYQYDELIRITSKELPGNYNISYNYLSNGNRTTDIIKKIILGNNTYDYKYNNLGNIIEVSYNNNLKNKFYYNEYNELVAEENMFTNERKEYQYDNYGNILSVVNKNMLDNTILYTNTYQYDNTNWCDKMISYNNTNISYDEIGNPTQIGQDISLSWINGKQLNSYTDSSKNLNVNYKYNANGIRNRKIVNNVISEYYLEGSNIIYEKRNNDLIYYLYDTSGLCGIEYNNNKYYYVKNLQEDIIGILDSNGNIVASYEYDSWGKIISIKDNNNNNIITNENHIALINPFRYRSYYYDSETELYYLNSRYYNPNWCRFISADSIICSNQDFTSFNLYTYASNNPIMYSDPSGYGIFKRILKKVIKTVKKVKKVVKTIFKTVTNIVNAVNKISNAVSNVASYDVGRSISKTVTTNIPIGFGLASITVSDTGSESGTIYGNGSIIKGSTAFDEYGKVSHSIEFNTFYSKTTINAGFGTFGISRGTGTYSFISGLEDWNFYVGIQKDTDVDDGTESRDIKISINPIVIVAVVGIVASDGFGTPILAPILGL